MLSNEILRTCRNEHVAAAALECIGGALRHRVAAAARAEGLTSGAYVARVVQAFPQKSGAAGLTHLQQHIKHNDMPVLAGLAHIVETALRERPCEISSAPKRDGDAKLWPRPVQSAASEAPACERR